MNAYNRGTAAKPNWWLRYYVNGEEIREPGRGSRKETLAWGAELNRQLKAGAWVHPRQRQGGAATFATYARSVLAKRVARGVKTAAKDERGHIENHLIPMFGADAVQDLTFKRIKDAFAALASGPHAGRTVRNIHSTLRAILIEAAEDGLIATAPTPLSAKRDHLPPPVDKDPDWRDSARFDRTEVAQLVGCDAVLSLRRVMYATYFLTGARFAELLPLRVSDYNARDPWPGLTIPASKVGRHVGRRMRHAPVFPELRTWLDWWLADEYAVLYGCAPRPDDLLFPTFSVRRRNKGAAMCSHNEIYKQWARNDLPAAGLHHRRLHDARRTFVSVLRSAGVPDKTIRAVTHASTGDRILDAYTSWEWSGLCQELGRVTWGLPAPPARTPVVPTSAEDSLEPQNTP